MDRQTCPWCDKPVATEEDWSHLPADGEDGMCWDPEQCYEDQDYKQVAAKINALKARGAALEARCRSLEADKRTLNDLAGELIDDLRAATGRGDTGEEG